jgi:hypothetical protein
MQRRKKRECCGLCALPERYREIPLQVRAIVTLTVEIMQIPVGLQETPVILMSGTYTCGDYPTINLMPAIFLKKPGMSGSQYREKN